jgi:hypothetical protein
LGDGDETGEDIMARRIGDGDGRTQERHKIRRVNFFERVDS